MRALVVAIVRGLVKGLVIGLALGLVLTFALRWPVPVGSLLGYLAAMAACGTTGIAGGDAPWREGAWLPAALKAVAGVAVGALAYWVLGAHLDAPLPELLSALLGPTAEGASASWIAAPTLSLTAIAASFGLLVELDHVGKDDEAPEKPKPAARAAEAGPAATQRERRVRPTVPRTEIENAETVPDSVPPPSRTRRDRPSGER
jgi:hypothetical protein